MIRYLAGYKYQLTETYVVSVGIGPAEDIETEYIALSTTGELTIRSGYAWDGPSGPTIDSKNFMRGSLVHDALYQLMRCGDLHIGFRPIADRLLRDMCRADGMSRLRAWYVHRSIARFGAHAAMPKAQKAVLTAP